MFVFVRILYVKTHAKHIHTHFTSVFYRLFIKSQCLLHQLTHFVNFFQTHTEDWRNKSVGRSIDRSFKPWHIQRSLPPVDHHHRRCISCCCFFSVRLIVQFEFMFVWHSVQLSVGARSVCCVSVQYNVSVSVYVHFPHQAIQIRFIDYCCDLINFYCAVAVLFPCFCCSVLLVNTHTYIHIHSSSIHIVENLIRNISLPKKKIEFFLFILSIHTCTLLLFQLTNIPVFTLHSVYLFIYLT